MIRRVASSVIATAAVLAANGAQAQGSGTAAGYYVAVPSAAVEKTRLITRSTLWSRQNGAFVNT